VQFRLEQLSAELESLRSQRTRKEQEVANMDNHTLKQRFQEILQNLNQEINQKEKQVCIIFIFNKIFLIPYSLHVLFLSVSRIAIAVTIVSNDLKL
jgi:hypothetical protein